MEPERTDFEDTARILIAASGTGGHLFPAVFIAQAIQKLSDDALVEFIGSGRPLEATIIDARGFHREVIDTVGIKSRGLMGLIKYLLTFPKAFLQVWRLFSRFRPNLVIGVGGYVSVIPTLVACIRGVPRWIHEAELRPGLANYWLSLIATKVSLAFEGTRMLRSNNTLVTGHPVRPDLLGLRSEPARVPPKNLLIMGGSQGARAIDKALLELVNLIRRHGLSVWHQCRSEDLNAVEQGYRAAGINCKVVAFIEDLASAYRWADLVISRAGAGAVMEIGVVNRPVIFVPYPHAQGNHQYHNAKVLAELGKALIIEEGEQFKDRLGASLESCLDPENFKKMRDAKGPTRPVNSAEMIASNCLKLCITSP